jgi:hypothetical protein
MELKGRQSEVIKFNDDNINWSAWHQQLIPFTSVQTSGTITLILKNKGRCNVFPCPELSNSLECHNGERNKIISEPALFGLQLPSILLLHYVLVLICITLMMQLITLTDINLNIKNQLYQGKGLRPPDVGKVKECFSISILVWTLLYVYASVNVVERFTRRTNLNDRLEITNSI